MIDHLIYAVPDLDKAIKDAESQLGVRPVLGGRHEKLGTHNALVSLGEGTYFEFMAPDPKNPNSEVGLLNGLDQSVLLTFVLSTSALEEDVNRVSKLIDLGEIVSVGRKDSQGNSLSWRMTLKPELSVPTPQVIPFLIEWETPRFHPALTSPAAGELESFDVYHPEPDRIQKIYDSMGLDRVVQFDQSPRLSARIGQLEIS